MKMDSKKSIIPIIVVTLILLAVLYRRIVARNLNADSLLSFCAGFAIVVVGYIVLKKIMNNKKD